MDIVASLIISVLEFVAWVVCWAVFNALPVIFYFTALALLFAISFGKVTVEFPKGATRIGWTGFLQLTRSREGRLILSPALAVIVGFVVWAVIVSAAIIAHAYRS